jgi:hypothetical protein
MGKNIDEDFEKEYSGVSSNDKLKKKDQINKILIGIQYFKTIIKFMNLHIIFLQILIK